MYGKVKSEQKTYTVQSLDVGSEIVAEVTGTGKYSGTVTTPATGKVLATVDLSNKETKSAPVVVADNVVYKDANGNDVTLSENDKVLFTVAASEAEVPETEKDKVVSTLQEQFADSDVNVEELNINYFAIDANLLVEPEEGDPIAIHPVGETILTLSKETFGFKADEDISQHIFFVGHTNKDGVEETVPGEVVEIDGAQYVQIKLNGLSTIYIGNVPPLTVTFDTDGGSEIPAKKVKLGEITPEVEAPTKDGYFFIGWNIDLNKTPIHRDIVVKALWLAGANVSQERLTILDANGDTVDNYSVSNGVVKFNLEEANDYGAELTYTLIVEAPQGAASYVLSDTAELSAAAKAEEAEALSDGIVEIPVVITDADGKVIVGKYPSYIKWFDENGEAIILEAVTVVVETDALTSTREATINVNRGVGKLEAILLAKNEEYKDYHAYLNGNLSGSGSSNNFTLNLNATFDKFDLNWDYKLNVDYANYNGFKLLFTPFEGESYADKAIKVSAYYTDENYERKDFAFNSKVNEEGLLEVTAKDNFDLVQLAGKSYSFYLYVTVEVGDRKQQVNVRFYDVYNTNNEYEHVTTDQWSEVIDALGKYDNVSVYYNGEDVTLDKELVLKPQQTLQLGSNLTIASGGKLQLNGNQFNAAYLYVEKNINVANGGKITTNSQEANQRIYSIAGIRFYGNFTVASGGEVVIPKHGYLDISSNENNTIVFEQGSVLKTSSLLYIYANIELNGEVSIDGGYVNTHNNVNINNKIELTNNARFWSYAQTTIQENGELLVANGQVGLYGKTYIEGKVTLQKGYINMSNVGYTFINDGSIDIASGANVYLQGTTLVNNGNLTGSGAINLVEEINAAANYDNGIEYVIAEGEVTPSNYSRYMFVRDPETSVTGTIFESKITGTGTVANSLKINESKIEVSE